ncbi:helix-turn-helix transcriptional regulator [Sphingomonas sp. KR1UV-12]|uniref:Helix-turn-helix transcriptional regulator n=1 Tax=Sphingomonas aurea TaxID=3063994 RepID=A0ABT9ENY1_9SPHN|nr:helix-turn-helix transcriptional regulator [Sphingomonas sp. KR1UV-12]MDP1028669.1 helix-turn-helix transcriptional regulator [Sphingomonas sp. KR1UV-12]
MQRVRPPSKQTLAVLDALARRPGEWRYGLELARLTGLKSGSLYPILIRCAERGLVEAEWLAPTEVGRPPRHAYRILAAGLAALRSSATTGGASSFKEQLA